MKPDKVSPSWRTASASRRSSAETRTGGIVVVFMQGSPCIASAMHSLCPGTALRPVAKLRIVKGIGLVAGSDVMYAVAQKTGDTVGTL